MLVQWPSSRRLLAAGASALLLGAGSAVAVSAVEHGHLRAVPVAAALGPIAVAPPPVGGLPSSALPPMVAAASPHTVAPVAVPPAVRPFAIPAGPLRITPQGLLPALDTACGNHFAFGFCTYWVAQHRCIPWFGSAASWLAAAALDGLAVGPTPAVGAIAVWGRGQSGASWSGHVALVVAVGPAPGVPTGWAKVSEMNWSSGWGRVDERLIRVGEVAGYVYAAGRRDPAVSGPNSGPPRHPGSGTVPRRAPHASPASARPSRS